MRAQRWTLIALMLTALSLPANAAEILVKKPAAKWASAPSTAETLPSKIDGLLRAPLPQSVAGTIMSPWNATRLRINIADGLKSVTLIDAKSSAVAGQWTIAGTTNPDDVSRISAAILEGMGHKARTGAKPRANKVAAGK
jgi:hypothetical protein